jgi:type II secretory pathway pseudopilin PulG
MRRQTHPLAGLLRRALTDRVRRTEAGDTLIEVLMTLVILSICALALIITFATAISTSVDHRNLAKNDTVLRNLDQTSFYQLQQQPTPKFLACVVGQDGTPTTSAYTSGPNALNFSPPTGYAVAIGTVTFWNGTNFQTTCPSSNAAQLITLTVTNPNGSIATTQTVVDGIGVLPTLVSVTAISPSSASQGASNLLVTVTGTGFLSGATLSFPGLAGTTLVGTTTFVSPTTLTAFVNVAATALAGSYDVFVTNPSQTLVSSATQLFTVIQSSTNGIHVSSVSTKIGDPAGSDPDEPTGGWDAWLTLTVENGNNAPLQGVVVNGSWSPTAGKFTTTCTTDATGACTVYDGYADVFPHTQSPLPTFSLSTSTSTNPAVGGLVLNGYPYNGAGGSWTVPVPT